MTYREDRDNTHSVDRRPETGSSPRRPLVRTKGPTMVLGGGTSAEEERARSFIRTLLFHRELSKPNPFETYGGQIIRRIVYHLRDFPDFNSVNHLKQIKS